MLTFLLVGAALAAPPAMPGTYGFHGRGPLDCASDPCSEVLPEAKRFEKPKDKPYVVGLDDAGEKVGWVALSSDLVGIKGYSGKPIHTLIGVDIEGKFTGGEVVHHSEPILLVGIPESKLQDFVDSYTGFPVQDKVVVGGGKGAHNVDAVSGATVTTLAENRTLLDSARVLAEDVGVLQTSSRVPGHFVVDDDLWSWDQMVEKKALAHMVVTANDMGINANDTPYIDLWFGLADVPQIGIPLLGDKQYSWLMDQLVEGEHLLVVFNSGTGTFKGSGFVRGGIFDRVRVEQGLRALTFTDKDYYKLDSPDAEGAPHLWEGAVFICRDNQLDPGEPFDLVFLGSSFTGAFSRDFRSFDVSFQAPRSVYLRDGPDPETLLWMGAWAVGWPKALGVGLYLLAVAALFVGRRYTTSDLARLKKIHTAVQLVSFVVLGLMLHAQPSITQLFTIVGSLVHGWHWSLFLSDPVLFVSWMFIAGVTFIWGRGVFCGWVCPYGAFNEICFKIGNAVGLPHFELPDRIHLPLRNLRYLVFAALLGLFLYSPELGEMAAEIEPFKSTFFVYPWLREWPLLLWWLVLAGLSFVSYRPFCRYVCPLGAAIALPSSFRASGPYRRDFCSQCKICTRGCEPRAIRPDGTIDPRECLNCWECEANWRSDQVCPPLVKQRRVREKSAKREVVVSKGEASRPVEPAEPVA